MMEVLLGSISDCFCMRLETTARYSVDQITAAQLCILHLEEFLCVDRCIILTILFNGPGPHFFCETEANYLLGIPITDVPHNDTPDPEICDRIIQVCCNC